MIIDAYTIPGRERETAMSADDLLRQMDAAGVAKAVIAPEDRELAVFNAEGNRRIVQLARQAGERFIPACGINPWYGSRGIEELRRAAGEGARIVVLAPAVHGFMLSDDLTDDLIAAAAELGMIVYVHTGPHSSAAPTQLALVVERFPGCRFILGHGGSTDYSHDMPSLLRLNLPNLWYELSFVRPWAVRVYATMIDESRFLFGSSAPRNDLAFELSQFDAYWPVRQHPGTYGGNLARLLGEETAA